MARGLTYEDLTRGEYIDATEFNGKPVTLTVKDVDRKALADMHGGTANKAVMWFEETDRQIVLNKTNLQLIKAMFGRLVDDWFGKRITFFPAKDDSGKSESGLAIRVYGSPDIDGDIETKVELPRKRPKPWTLHKTRVGKRDQQAALPDEPNAEAAAEAPDDGDDIPF